MATVHQLSMLTNSYCKPPIKSQKSRTNGTNNVCDAHELTVEESDPVQSKIEEDLSNLQLTSSVNFDTTMMDTLNVDLSNLSDAEFYKRLSDLKREHKKTLEFCEQLYNKKLSESRTAAATVNSNVNMPVACVDTHYTLSVSQNGGTNSETIPKDHVKDMSPVTKPPTGRPTPKTSSGTMNYASPKSKRVWASSNSEDFWKPSSGNSSDGDYCNDEPLQRSFSKLENSKSFVESLEESRISSRSRIDDMWENFSVRDYAPERLQMRQRSSSMSQLSTQSKKDTASKSSEWRHRITIPKPFSFDLRESNKTPKKTKAMEEVEQKREEDIRKNEEECQKKFKARPVPAHVYMPLYDEIMEEKETRRRMIHKTSAEVLRSMQKPFKFDIREQEIKKFRRSQSSPISSSSAQISKKPKTTFKARPFPDHIFDDTVNDRMKEEEEYRKIRIQMRAEEMLFSSKLPANMGSRDKKYTEGKERLKLYAQRAKKAGITTEHKFKPKINDTVPDFEQLHNDFLLQASRKKQQKEATVCKPFKLRSGNFASKKHKIYEDIDKDEQNLKENKWPFRSTASRPLSKSALSTSMDSIPAKMTCAAQLRASSTKARMQSEIERELIELEKERRRKRRERELQQYISERATDNDNTCILKDKNKKKLKEFKLAEKARQEEYQRQLEEMQSRVQQRPLLFEKTMQANAKRRAEKKYQETLERAGLNDEFIVTKGTALEDDIGLDSDGASDGGHYDYSSRQGSQSFTASQHYHYSDNSIHDHSGHYSDHDNSTDADQDDIEEDISHRCDGEDISEIED